MIRLYEQTGMPAEAVAQLEKAAALSPEPNTMASLAHAYAISGQKGKALKIPTQLELRQKRKHSPLSVCLNLGWSLMTRRKGLQP
jgi:hypothetical protein